MEWFLIDSPSVRWIFYHSIHIRLLNHVSYIILYYIIFLNSKNKSKNKVDLPNIDFDGIGGNAGASGRAAVWVMNIGMMTKSTVRLTTTLLASMTCLWLALSI